MAVEAVVKKALIKVPAMVLLMNQAHDVGQILFSSLHVSGHIFVNAPTEQ
jgi:hypothetical protein